MAGYIIFNKKKLYIHHSGSFYYLSPKKQGAVDELPSNYKIKYNKNGLPFIKKIK